MAGFTFHDRAHTVHVVHLGVALLLLAAAASVRSTPVPGTATEQQIQQQRQRALREQQELRPEVKLTAPASSGATAIPLDEQPCRRITSITLEGADAAYFAFALDAAEAGRGQCLGSRGINALVARVQGAVIARGYITTRILVAAQDLSDGQLVLSVLAGRVGSVGLAADADTHATVRNALPLAHGDLLDLHAIEQGLENFKRLPTAQADIAIVPAADADGTNSTNGMSDLLISYHQPRPLRLSLSWDDGGTRATGKQKAGVTVAWDNLLTLNDLFYASFNRGLGPQGRRGSQSHTLHYSMPWGWWQFGATSSGSQYHQTVAGMYEDFVYSGHTRNTELSLTRVLLRQGGHKTSLQMKWLQRRAANAIDDAEVRPQRRYGTGWETSLRQRSAIGNASAEIGLAWRQLHEEQGAAPRHTCDLPQRTSRHGLWLADASLNVPWRLDTIALRYALNARAQWNRGTPPPQDQFAIGGRYTIRGYDGEANLQAARGWLARNELALTPGASAPELYLGWDVGMVYGSGAEWLSGRRLAGAVIGLRGALGAFGTAGALSGDMFVATPLTRLEGVTAASVTGGVSLLWSF